MTNKNAAIQIITRLRENGFEALLAGGCVRDMLIGRVVKDYDIATSAGPDDVIKLFKRTLKVGVQFGVVIILTGGCQIEIATFRTETDYADGRHPSKVQFTTAKEDAVRRDFTINGMFYDPVEDKVIDYVNGRADLEKHIIRTIGNADQRFSEDYLRMLRVIRFAAQLDFTIEPKTWSAVCKNAKNITQVSGERIAMELDGILTSPNRASGALMLFESSLAGRIFPGFTADQAKAAAMVLDQLKVKAGLALGLASLFVECPAKAAIEQCRKLKLSREQYKRIRFLLEGRDKLLNDKMSLAELRMIAAETYFEDLYQFQYAIQKASGKTTASLKDFRKRLKALDDIELLPPPLLNGNDLIRLGVKEGPTIGKLAKKMYTQQLEGYLQSPAQAGKWIKEQLKNKPADK